MGSFLKLLLNWSEVWAPLIPLSFLLFRRRQPRFLTPVIVYLVIAFFINLTCDIISEFYTYLPGWLQSNTHLYNVHSIIRFICFCYFFIELKKILPVFSLVIIIINFSFVEDFGNPDHLSGNLLAVESYLLLIFCMQYYLAKLRDEADDITSGPDFWVVTGLSIYVVINFFVFLFYVPMLQHDIDLALNIWDVHNIAYILLCIFITKAFYAPARHQYTV
jgi:hypothetical protein